MVHQKRTWSVVFLVLRPKFCTNLIKHTSLWPTCDMSLELHASLIRVEIHWEEKDV
jgi:hypothetical protein